MRKSKLITGGGQIPIYAPPTPRLKKDPPVVTKDIKDNRFTFPLQ